MFLFVRHRKHEAGRTAAYTCLGAADYSSHQGSGPIAITWRLRKPMPDDFFERLICCRLTLKATVCWFVAALRIDEGACDDCIRAD